MRGSAWPAFGLAVRTAGAGLWASWMCLGGATACAHSGPCSVALRPPVPSSRPGTCRRSWRSCASSDHPHDWMVLGRPSVLGGGAQAGSSPASVSMCLGKTVSSSSAAGRVILQALKAVGALGLLLNHSHPSCIITSNPLMEHLLCACHCVRCRGDYCSYYFTSERFTCVSSLRPHDNPKM